MANRVIDAVLRLTDSFTGPAMKSIQTMTSMSKAGIKVGKDIEKAGASITKVGAGLTTAVTLPLAGVATAAIKTAADFESSMSNVHAIMGDTYDDSLTQFAQQLGATTAWSAQEVAQAMQYTGMAGWTAQENIQGLKGILDLASASGTELALTSDIVTDAISAFGYTAAESGMFADTMTAACTSANVSVETLGESYKYCGALAGTMGYELDQVTTALAVMGNNGIKGSQAGTALRSAISNLSAPTKQMKEGMDALGISLKNQDGSMKTFEQVIDNVRGSFQGLSADQQAAYAKQIFGKQAMAGMLAIINTSTEEYDALAAAIDNSGGAADKAAKTQLDNLSGQLTLLKSAIEGAAIAFGNRMLPYLKKATTFAQGLMDKINGLSDAQMDNIIKWAGIAAAAGPVLIVLGKIVSGVGKGIQIFNKFGVALKAAGSFSALLASPLAIVIGVIAAVGLVVAAVVTHFDKFKEGLRQFGPSFDEIKQKFAAIGTLLAPVGAGIRSVVDVVGGAIAYVAGILTGIGAKAFSVFLTVVIAVMTAVRNAIQTAAPVIQRVMAVIRTTFIRVANVAATTLRPIITQVFTSIQTVIAAVVNFVANTLMPAFSRAWQMAVQVVTAAINGLTPVIRRIMPVVQGVISFIQGVVVPVVSGVIGAITGIITGGIAVMSTIINSIMTVLQGVTDFVSGVFTGNWELAWNGVSQIFSGIVSGIEGTFKGVINGLIGALNNFISGLNGISIPDWVPGIGGKSFSIPTIPTLGVGTDNWAGGIAQVHERGGEIIDLPRGSRVYPHDESLAMARREGAAAAPAAGNFTITGNTFYVREEADINKVGDALFRKIRQAYGNRGGWTFSGDMA